LEVSAVTEVEEVFELVVGELVVRVIGLEEGLKIPLRFLSSS
jgi:hypothetical protein